MPEPRVSRRRLIQYTSAGITVLLTAAQGGWVSWAAGRQPTEQKSNPGMPLDAHQADSLRRLVKCLFPYQGLNDEPYRLVVDGICQDSDIQDITMLLRGGVAALDEASGGSLWRELSTERQIEVLKGIEDTRFFRLMLDAGIHGLHSNREVWRLIGYQGSSVEYGGYLHRGFNDIDWLPVFDG